MAGVSDNENKQIAKQWIDELDPNTVLDIGAGIGTYSMLARQEHQHWSALEVFFPYVKQYALMDKYEHVFIGDARFMDYDRLLNYARASCFELIIAADMLEHMRKEEAQLLIARLLTHCRHLLICFPVEHQEQHAGEEGNDFETHVDHWHFDEMNGFLNDLDGAEVIHSLKGDVLAYFLVRGEQ